MQTPAVAVSHMSSSGSGCSGYSGVLSGKILMGGYEISGSLIPGGRGSGPILGGPPQG